MERARAVDRRCTAALLLESARLATAAGMVPAYTYPLFATFLLTGGRRSEVCGLEVADVSFDHKTVRFRKNLSRKRLKTRTVAAHGTALAAAREGPPDPCVQPGPAADNPPFSKVLSEPGGDAHGLSEGGQPG